MRNVTDRYLTAIANPIRRLAEVMVYLPGESTGTLLDIEADNSTVTMDGSNNSRYSASISLSPDLESDVFTLAATPGAKFTIRAGVSYGAGQTEWVDCGVLYASQGSRDITVGDSPLTLQDAATILEECRFTFPWSVAAGTDRQEAIAAMVLDAIPAATIRKLATPTLMGDAVYETDRLAGIEDIVNGGVLDAAFDAAGEWVIRDSPLITPASPAWVAKTGEQGTILPGAQRNIPLNRLYNMVIVLAPDPSQTWGAVTYQIADPTHPRYWANPGIGKRPFFVNDPTITSLAQAQLRAQTTLTRLLTTVEEIALSILGNVALEYGDTVAVAHEATDTDPGLAANYLTENWNFNLGTGAMDLTGRSTDQPELEEV